MRNEDDFDFEEGSTTRCKRTKHFRTDFFPVTHCNNMPTAEDAEERESRIVAIQKRVQKEIKALRRQGIAI
jgi:hypothetical protein